MEPSARPRIRPPFLDLRPSVPRTSIPGSSSVQIVPWFVALLWTAATAAFASTPPPTVLVWAEDPRFENVARRVVAEIEGIQGPADPPWTVRLVPRPEGDTPSARLVAGGEGASLAVPVGPKPGDVLPSGTAEEVLPDAVWVDPVGWLGPPFEAGDDAGPLGGPLWVRSAPLRSKVEGDLRAFRHLLSQVGAAPEDRPPTVAVPLDPWLAAAGPEIALGGQAAGVSVRPVEPAELLGLPRGSAVYLPPGSTPEGLGGMAQRGLIVFSGRGGAGSSADVGSGALAARSAGDGGRTLARLAALEVLSRIRGLGPGAAPAPSTAQASSPVPPVPSALEARLVLDLDLAQRLGLDVPWRLRLYSETFGDPTVGEVLTLDEARRGAVDANLDLRARALATAAAEDDVRRAVAALRPQVTVRGEGRILDEDSAEASFGQSPERLVTATGEATWILFSEDARSALEVRRRVQAARELELRQVELDLGLEAASTYLRLARLLAVEAIERQTLSRTLAELDAARARRGVGASSRADVARLESRAARDRRALVGAHGARRSAEVTLARLLSRPQDAPIVPGDPSGDDSLPLE
ncbi:MAG: TolC family protein, partial [Acidobacteriota bacterium]